MTAVDDLWGDMPGDLLVVTRDDLEQLAVQVAADVLHDVARDSGRKLRAEFLEPGGKADDWTEHRRRVWSEGVSMALACVRRAGGALAHGRRRL